MEKEETIRQAYVEYVLEKGQSPVSVFAFAKQLGWREEEFYEAYNSFEAIEKAVWKGYFDQAIARLETDEVYAQYSVREKLLSFYFTWIEVLKSNRSFVVNCQTRLHRRLGGTPSHLVTFKKAFLIYVRELLAEGRESREVIARPLISDRYAGGLWMQLLLVLNFWVRDDSKGFEKTDAAIEKAVNTSFELMGRLPIDSVVDLAKFLHQNR